MGLRADRLEGINNDQLIIGKVKTRTKSHRFSKLFKKWTRISIQKQCG